MPILEPYAKQYGDKLTVFYEPVFQVRNTSTFIYWKPDSRPRMSDAARWMMSQRMRAKKSYSGTVTHHTKKRIRTAVNLLLQVSPTKRILNEVTGKQQNFKINFITLTIPVQEYRIDAKDCYTNCLKPFLQWMQKTLSIRHYIWKAELQGKTDYKGKQKKNNGQLHYHITTNMYIHYQTIQNKWNYLLSKAGYMNEYNERFKRTNPNTTDVHAVYKIKDLEAYLVKYISKEDKDSESIKGKIWDCSKTLKGKKLFSVEWNETNEHRLAHYLKTSTVTEIDSEHGIFLKMQKHWFEHILTKQQLQEYKEYILTLK